MSSQNRIRRATRGSLRLLLRCWITGNVVVLVAILVTFTRGDEIELRDGSRLQGIVVSQTTDTVTIDTKTISASDVLAVTIAGKRRVCRKMSPGVRRQAYSDAKAFKRLSSEAYQRVFEEFTSKGFQPVVLRGYANDGESRYDVTMAKGPKWKWYARHDCPHATFIEVNEHAETDGYSLVVHSQFRIGDKILHAAVWELPPRIFHGNGALPRTGVTDLALAPIDEAAQTFLQNENIPGMTIAIARHGRLVYARGFGYADVEKKQPVQPESLFRIASVSKPILATTVMQLVEQGKLALDTRMVDVLPDLLPIARKRDPQYKMVTVRHLLQHTSGWSLKHQMSGPTMIEIARALHGPSPPGREDVVRYWLSRPLDFVPGDHFEYGNLNYCVLARIVERVTGKSYEAYVLDSVLTPIGIQRMRIGHSQLANRADGEVRYYTRYGDTMPSVFQANLGQRVPVQYGAWDLEAMDGNGGWLASAVDLVTFASVLYDEAEPRILSRACVHQMFAPPPYPFAHDGEGQPRKSYYACGWVVHRLDDGQLVTKHNGGFPGTSALLVRRPDGLCWAIICNIRWTIGGQQPVDMFAPRLSRAIHAVRDWPGGSLLGR